MNSIKKVFNHRNSTSSDSSEEAKRAIGSPTSPTSPRSDVSSTGRTTVDGNDVAAHHGKIPTGSSGSTGATGAAGVAGAAGIAGATGASRTGGGTANQPTARVANTTIDGVSNNNTGSKVPSTGNATGTIVDNSTRSTGSTNVGTGSTTGVGGVGAGPGRSQEVAANDGTIRHSHGHHSGTSTNPDLSTGKVTQSVEHLGEITSKTHHSHTIEEVERQRELERHQHHIQVHHQPIKHEEHSAEQLHQNIIPVTKVAEKHASTDKDAKLLATIATGHGHKNEVKHAPKQHQIVDRGEVVTESIHHHIHNVVVPLISHDQHEHHRIKTVIPTHHVMHEAPIIHESSTLEAISKDDFLKRGGILGSKTASIDQAGLLNQGKCDRTVDGVADKMAQEMKLSTTMHSKAL